jgi:hypothetical protein
MAKSFELFFAFLRAIELSFRIKVLPAAERVDNIE